MNEAECRQAIAACRDLLSRIEYIAENLGILYDEIVFKEESFELRGEPIPLEYLWMTNEEIRYDAAFKAAVARKEDVLRAAQSRLARAREKAVNAQALADAEVVRAQCDLGRAQIELERAQIELAETSALRRSKTTSGGQS